MIHAGTDSFQGLLDGLPGKIVTLTRMHLFKACAQRHFKLLETSTTFMLNSVSKPFCSPRTQTLKRNLETGAGTGSTRQKLKHLAMEDDWPSSSP